MAVGYWCPYHPQVEVSTEEYDDPVSPTGKSVRVTCPICGTDAIPK